MYAARFQAPAKIPRVGLILAGFGLDHAQSEEALAALPAAVTLALSPYARGLDALLPPIRAAGHEYLLAIPMEPRHSELNDAAGHALLTSLSWADNAARLDWALSRATGFVGVTDALGRLRGERFTSDPEAMAALLDALGRRGLLYAGAVPEGAGQTETWTRRIDLVVDDPEDAAGIDARLDQLVVLARRQGSALGLASIVRPVMVARIKAWTSRLAAQGVVLAPVSALAAPFPVGAAAR